MKNFDYTKSTQNKAYEDFDKRKRLMKFNRYFSQVKIFTTAYWIVVTVLFIALLVLLYKLNTMNLSEFFATGQMQYKDASFLQLIRSNGIILGIFIILAVIGYFKFAYQVRVSYGNLDIGQKGTARWTMREELRDQYKWIKENKEPFSGMGGIPIAREEDQLAIDDSNTNSLVIGITRSGKGQMTVNPMIDILSRAKEKCSMIVTDPKLELSSMAIPTLKKRGYRCYVLNLIDPEFSMGYNPLKSIVDEYMDDKIDTAQQLCSSLAYNIFAPQPGEKDPYFTDQARNVFVAAAMAEVADNVAADVEANLRYRYEHEKKEDERQRKYEKELYGEDYIKYKVKQIIDQITEKEGDLSYTALLADMEVYPVADVKIKDYILDICEKRDEHAAEQEISHTGVYLNHDEFLEPLLKPIIDFEYKRSMFKRKDFYESYDNVKQITIYSITKLCNSLSSVKIGKGKTMLDHYFESRPEDDFARITYGAIISASENTKGTIMSVFRAKLTIFGYDNIAKMTAESSIDFADVAFSEQPVAIFIGLPDYDASNWFLATVFINQMYFVLAKLATAMPGGKLYRRVHFILDEFGNLPPLDNLSNIVTVCLGRNIVFTFIIQAFAQIDTKYESDAKTIIGNCGNQIYIMTSDENTAEDFSKNLSTESIITTNRTGKKLAINKELTEMVDEKPLLSAYELMHLERGEMIVARFMKREDNDGKYIKATPIKNMSEYRMKYAYEFLSDDFPSGQQLYESPNLKKIRTLNKNLENLQPKIVDVGLETTTDIVLKNHARSAQEYMDHESWRDAAFLCEDGLSGDDFVKMNKVFNLLNLPEADRKLYKLAGTMQIDPDTGESEILYPESVLRNGMLEDYAHRLMAYRNKKISDKGYELLNVIRPLKGRAKTKEERNDEIEFEAFLLEQMKTRRQDFYDEE